MFVFSIRGRHLWKETRGQEVAFDLAGGWVEGQEVAALPAEGPEWCRCWMEG